MEEKEKEEFLQVDLKDKNNVLDLVNKVNSSKEPVLVALHNDDKYSFGVAVPRNHPAATSYLEDVADYNDTRKDIYDQIRLCEKLYKWEGIVGTVIDMYTDLSYSPVKIDNIKNDKAVKLVDYFLKNVNISNNNITNGIDSVNRESAFSFYLKGNVLLYKKWSTVFVNTLKGKYKLPMSITLLDPKIVEIDEDSAHFGNKVFKITFGRLFGKMRMLTEGREKLLDSLPIKIRNRFKNAESIIIDADAIYHIKRKGFSYSLWGIPYLTRVFSAIAAKRKLRTLDDSTIDGLINSIILIKVGDPKRDDTLKASGIRAIANLLKNPTASLTMVVPYHVTLEQIRPNGEILGFGDRYTSADKDIAYGMGIPVSLLTGEGDKSGDVWASILFWTERLEEYRQEFSSFLYKQVKEILENNGFEDEEPVVSFIKPKISKDTLRTVILAYYDRGLISKETATREAGFDLPSESKRRKIEKSSGIDDIMLSPTLPYSKNEGTNSGNPGPKDSKTPSKKRSNTKKDSKVLELNTKPKKIAPNVGGNTRDRVKHLFDALLGEEKFEKDKFVEKIVKFSRDIEFMNSNDNIFRVNSNDLLSIASFIEINSTNSYDSVLGSLDTYFILNTTTGS